MKIRCQIPSCFKASFFGLFFTSNHHVSIPIVIFGISLKAMLKYTLFQNLKCLGREMGVRREFKVGVLSGRQTFVFEVVDKPLPARGDQSRDVSTCLLMRGSGLDGSEVVWSPWIRSRVVDR